MKKKFSNTSIIFCGCIYNDRFDGNPIATLKAFPLHTCGSCINLLSLTILIIPKLSKVRIFFLPGLSEEKWIFDKIAPFIDGEKAFIDNWSLLTGISEKGLEASVYATFLIERFQINKQDLVIGHSMGGWIALQIKNLTGCPAIQISSFTDIEKVFKPGNRHLIFWLAKRGFGLNTIAMNILVFLAFRQEISKKVFKEIFKKTMRENKTTFAKQLQVVYNPVNQVTTVSPDLRIHAKKDQIICPPDEPFVEVPGDHFALYAYPDKVYTPINNFINSLQLSEKRKQDK